MKYILVLLMFTIILLTPIKTTNISTNHLGEFDKEKYTFLGEFEITHYTASVEECGKSDGITATGTKVKENHTIAVDPSVIPYGTKVVIDGVQYVAEDTGGAIKGNKIDIYVADKTEAINRGRIIREVWRK